MHYHPPSPLRTIGRHLLALGPGIAKAERGNDPYSHSEVVEVVEVGPDTALTVASLHHCEDVHQE
jgi:hypothetical protein